MNTAKYVRIFGLNQKQENKINNWILLQEKKIDELKLSINSLV